MAGFQRQRSLRSDHRLRDDLEIADVGLVASETEDEYESLVDGTKLACLQAAGGEAEALRIDDRRLLDEDARLLSFESDGRAEARRPGAGRSGCNQNGAEVEELVGLDDDGIASPALLVPAPTARRRQAEDLTADHLSRRGAERAPSAAPE